MDTRKTYLGDGVYVEFDGFSYVLTTENGVEATNRIVLEPDVYEALVAWVAAVRVGIPHTLHGFLNGAWPKGSIGLRLVGGRVVWTAALYPDGSNGNRVQVSRIVHEGGKVFTRVAFYEPDKPIEFVYAEAVAK